MKLIAFPFAGGNKYSFDFLRPYLQSNKMALKVLEYPGRGQRIMEPLLKSIDEIVDDAYKNILNEITEEPYIIYGHSMGGLVGYLIAKKLVDQNIRKPYKLIVSGSTAPSKYQIEKIHQLESDGFWEKVNEFGGMPNEILKEESFRSFFEPILRSDIQIVEEYEYREKTNLKIPIDVFYGDEEVKLSTEKFSRWSHETSESVQIFELKGDHFFIHENVEFIANYFIKEFENII